ncbi:hypothetical protein B0H17DRAFT_636708 [Mycena rosella]|uniref:T6SS Phospholipase effector Tle1-like catalytic domain-containing protein n=1 Tax=Mycena rosella TaxID=1033263 RepID=A0AAD7DDY2_MYCRO|nr:hypothetical protein B0H17DRAFT_636708 [Mycena rosella]
MNFQSLPIPPPRIRALGDPLRCPRTCGCNCIAACSCSCSCRDHCTCKAACEGDCGAHAYRNLVVSLDGAVNKFGAQNTNVVELHSRVLVDPVQKQLTYYSCGAGTYVSSRPGTFKHLLDRFRNAVHLDLATAWDLKKSISKAYQWLCEEYQPGDRIFLFGFARGAYQARTLAAMIEQVGLVNAGNQELIPSAYEIFVESQGYKSDMSAVEIFKNTFSRGVKVHFVGAWQVL